MSKFKVGDAVKGSGVFASDGTGKIRKNVGVCPVHKNCATCLVEFASGEYILCDSEMVKVEPLPVQFNEQRADAIGQNGNDGEHYALSPAYQEKADEIEAMPVPEELQPAVFFGSADAPRTFAGLAASGTVTSDGSTASYYQLPAGATELQPWTESSRKAMGLADTGTQPAPTRNNEPAVWTLVMRDMTERDLFGAQKYATRLQPNNGRDYLLDAYQEALDLAVYLRGAIYERDKK